MVGSWVAGAVALVVLAKSTPVVRDARRLNTKLLLVSDVWRDAVAVEVCLLAAKLFNEIG